ncbi:Ser Thr phosphatase superfamily [Pyrenophora seminiperda CCB06]|uniref:Ser Thr phosphatase superfamily n=1 Tax=Pyrenophora seminiperda CCB06 TaxID=1302712 RepID=A0A3M7MEH8_9PLEO|nr:Ser Thr phosphatase superfamily [Pyrenophora seminiperda CCB06]
MSLFTPQFQIVSDLHLETPLATPQYASFRLNVQADNILLLGDVGLVVDARLFDFLCRTLEQNRGCRIFYIMGNHEPYQTTYEHAYTLLRDFEREAKENLGGRFKFLCRDRYDVNSTITILGCTLWSSIQPTQAATISSRSTDLNSERGIKNWTLKRHAEEHKLDVAWLNAQISTIESDEPHRHVIIATHHSPTMDPRANAPHHKGSPVSSNFVTDLSQQLCWQSPMVRLWAFGHTHFTCSFRDEETGKLVVANQKGYAGLGAAGKKARMKVKVVEAGKVWTVVAMQRKKSCEEEQAQATDTQTRGKVGRTTGGADTDVRIRKRAFCHRLAGRLHRLWGW